MQRTYFNLHRLSAFLSWMTWARTLSSSQQDRLYEIVDERYVNKRPWIVTTNSNRLELESKLSLGVVDRLFDTHRSPIATLTGTSWRQ